MFRVFLLQHMNNACYMIDIAILKADKHWFTQFTFGPW